MSTKAKILVTGSGGFVGSHVVRLLLETGKSVRAMLKPGEGRKNLSDCDVETVEADIRDAAMVSKAVLGCQAVIHLAAIADVWHHDSGEFIRTNVEGTKNICEAALSCGVERFIYTSSAIILGPPPHGYYAASKISAEAIVDTAATRGLSTVTLRPTSIMGPRDIYRTPMGRFLQSYFMKKIPAYYDAGINVVDVIDVALAHIHALSPKHSGKKFLICGHNVFLRDLFAALEKESGIAAPQKTISYPTALFFAYIFETLSKMTRHRPKAIVDGVRLVRKPWFFHCQKDGDALGVIHRAWPTTIRETVRWYLT